MATFVNLDTVFRGVTGNALPAAWCDQVNDDINVLYGDTAWTSMSGFTNGWTSTASPNLARYRLVGNIVEIQGAVTGGTVTTAILTMPTGYRPTESLLLTTSNGGTSFASIAITSAGVISQVAGTNTNLHLSCSYTVL